ncbi:MAG: GNAT family N-acetyltransferase [Anaerolineae bacterium]|nr:GNAT family N-acetyltransferase [Anaerolineae bacterium]MDW8172889.1 GNAT family N-acetyltransferase [Anaerolineae bacterium]
MMAQLFLSPPDVIYQASYISYVREMLAEGSSVEWKPAMLERHFAQYVQMLLSKATEPAAGMVAQNDYWLIADSEVVGRCGVRHELNAALLRYGGHISYDVRPSARRRGYGLRQCQLALGKAHDLGITRALITCDDDNLGSIRIIESCGGVLQDKVDNGRHTTTRRYWVDTARWAEQAQPPTI